ncbi:general stress protein [Kribbella sp. NPDC005582]|uniref:general stress protein n=1 Tax=Kribbella sp. NPDC005582 TaxID=3156893 RepID=UPI0033A60A5C
MRPDQASVVPSSVVASVSTFADAQQTVGYLRSFGMDSRSLEVVGAELRLSRRQAAVPVVRRTLASAGAGALLGVLSGVFVTLVAETTLSAFSVLLWGFVYGVLVGALWGLFQGLVRNRPDAPPVEVITPTYYEVRCAVDDAAVALRLLDSELEPRPEVEAVLPVEAEPVVASQPAPEPVVEPEPVVSAPEPEPAAESKPADTEPVVDQKPPVRRQPAQTSRKTRAKKKTARSNAA